MSTTPHPRRRKTDTTPKGKANPAEVRQWIRVGRDVILAGLAIFIFIHETIAEGPPSPYLMGAGLVMLGLPSALRLVHTLGDDDGATADG